MTSSVCLGAVLDRIQGLSSVFFANDAPLQYIFRTESVRGAYSSVCFLRGLAVSAFLWCMIVSFFIRHGFKEVSSDRSHNVLDLNWNIVPPVSFSNMTSSSWPISRLNQCFIRIWRSLEFILQTQSFWRAYLSCCFLLDHGVESFSFLIWYGLSHITNQTVVNSYWFNYFFRLNIPLSVNTTSLFRFHLVFN